MNCFSILLEAAKDTEIGKNMILHLLKIMKHLRNEFLFQLTKIIKISLNVLEMVKIIFFGHTPIKWFAKSSGTTNAKSKFIPVSMESLEDCHYAASKDLLCMYFNNNENSQLFTGKSLRLGGSKELYRENGTVFGDLSAILIDNMPFWAEFSSTPSNKVSLMSDWEYKMQAIVDETINENVTSLGRCSFLDVGIAQ